MVPDVGTEVRVHLRLGALRLDYEGDQTFYEQHVESLVAAAAGNAKTLQVRPPAAPAPGASSASSATAPRSDGGGASSAAGEASAKPKSDAKAAAPAFVPQSGEFGRFVKRVQAQAQQTDQQVTAFAFYLWNYEQRASFTAAEIEGCFKVLGFPVPDVPAILNDLTERKRFLENASPTSWRLSRKGENYVKTRLLAA